MKRAVRLHALSETLRRNGLRGCSAERLERDFGVWGRTVKRDLDALERSGAPIWSRPGPGGGYGLATGASLPPVSLSAAQAVVLMAAVSAAPSAPHSDLAVTGIQKILDVLDPRTRARADEPTGRVRVNVPPSASRGIRSALEEAMAEQRVVRIRYTSNEGPARPGRIAEATPSTRSERRQRTPGRSMAGASESFNCPFPSVQPGGEGPLPLHDGCVCTAITPALSRGSCLAR